MKSPSLRLFFWTTNHLVSKLEPWERHSKPDRCLYFWTTNHLTSWLVPCVLCSKPVWTSFRLISDAYRSNGLHCRTMDRFNSIRGHWCGESFPRISFQNLMWNNANTELRTSDVRCLRKVTNNSFILCMLLSFNLWQYCKQSY